MWRKKDTIIPKEMRKKRKLKNIKWGQYF